MRLNKPVFQFFAFAILFWFAGIASTTGNEVDVYFIVGQSNAINFAKEAGTGSETVDFSLHFARTSDIFNDFPNHTGVAQSFSSNNLNASLATSILASRLQKGDRDVAIFSFARNGAGLHLNTSPDGNPWIWYPGEDPAANEFYNDSLYANFVSWNQTRLDELIEDGFTPTVKGLFWFQGEKDGRLGDHDFYEDNFDNLIYRFRNDYGEDLPVVATQIREVTDTAANRAVINETLNRAASEDLLLEYVTISDLEFRSPADVHLTGNGHADLAPRWSDAMLRLQAIAPVDSFTITDGEYFEGDNSSLRNNDNVDLSVRRAAQTIQSRVFVEFNGVSSVFNPTSFAFTLQSSVFARTPVVQNVDLYNFENNLWEEIDIRDASKFVDATVVIEPEGNLSRFVSDEGEVLSRVRYQSSFRRQVFSANIDQANWSIE